MPCLGESETRDSHFCSTHATPLTVRLEGPSTARLTHEFALRSPLLLLNIPEPGRPILKVRGNRFHLVRSADQFEDDLAFGSEVVGDFAVHGHCVILRGV